MPPVPGRRVRPAARRALFAVAAVLIASAWGLAGAGRALVVSSDLAAPDAVVSLASHEWERLPAAATLAQRHPSARLLLTRPASLGPYNCHLCPERVRWLEALGVRSDRVTIVAQTSTNTYEEAVSVREFAVQHKLSRLLIVTSPYHSRRALSTFRTVLAGTAIVVGIVAAPGAQGNPERWWASAFDRHYVVYEWAALLKYRAAHRIPLGTAGRQRGTVPLV